MSAPKDFLDGFYAPLAAATLAAVVTLVLVPMVQKLALSQKVMDDPKRDARRVHTEPIPKWGGLAIFGGILAAILTALPIAYPHKPFPPYVIGMLVVSGGIMLAGAWDDKKDFSPKIQLAYLIGAGLVVQLFGDDSARIQIGSIGLPFTSMFLDFPIWASFAVTAFYMLVVTKTVDFQDGLDGLASGISGIAAGTLAVIAVYEGQPRIALIAAAILGACLGFLRYNANPARIFMGTGGSQLLGFMLACLSVVGAFKTAAALAIFVPVLVFGVPIFDAFFVMTRRLLSGDSPLKGDKRHLHHTLLRTGLNQKQVVYVLYALAIGLSGVLLWVVRSSGEGP